MSENRLISTESDVEQKVIYSLLTEPVPKGLGFSESDILTKPNIRKIEIDKGSKRQLYYPDYVILSNGLPTIIVEAKAPGEGLLESAAREARLYATEINSSYKMGVNPSSIVLTCDGEHIAVYSWDDANPIIQLSVDDISPVNIKFNNLIERYSFISIDSLSKSVLKNIKKEARYLKPVFMLGGKTVMGESVGQNSFGSNISLEYKYLFNPESLEDRESVVKNAYVASRRKQAHVSQIDKVIRASIPNSMLDARSVTDTSKPDEIISSITDTNRVKNEICLLIGSVGSGKSTFTDYLRSVALPSPLVGSTAWYNVNLNNAPLSRELIYDWIVDKITESIKVAHKDIDFDHIDIIREIYNAEILKLEKGTLSLFDKTSEKYAEALFEKIEELRNDKVQTLRSILNYLYAGSNKLVVIVLDNCDKRIRDDQLLMFEVASWLKNNFSCMIFLPLRDSTYDQYCNQPPLDTVIKDLVFRIDPPLLERVVYERLNFALRECAEQQTDFSYYLPNNARVECSREEIGVYLRAVVTALFQDNLFRRIISGLAGRNIRKGLEILLDFCKSGHISEDLIFRIRQSGGDAAIPRHLVFRILLKGDKKYYFDRDSKVKNLFFSESEDSLPDPFVRISILIWLKERFREYGPNGVKGYHKVEHLVKDLQIQRHRKERVLVELKTLADANCINTETQGERIEEIDLISIAPAGFIHLDLLKNITYLSTVSEDTLFRELDTAKKISENITGRGKHKQWSKQADISNSKALIEYMNKYFNEYCSVSELIDSTDSVSILDEIKYYVNEKADNDVEYKKKNISLKRYKAGASVQAQVVSIQSYGIFVEFELGCTGLIKKETLKGDYDIFTNLEEGDWMMVEIISYSPKHEKFEVKYIELIQQ